LSQHPRVKRIRCQGTVAAFELDAGSTSYLNPVGKQLQRHCLELGVYIRPLGNVVYLLPPLSISADQLQQCYAALKSGINAL
jgi:adenosylmethionine-8-amino-7-oxononanoate aminotransferase